MASPWVYAAVSCGELRITRAEIRGVLESKGTAGGRASALVCVAGCIPGGSAGGGWLALSPSFPEHAARQNAAIRLIVRALRGSMREANRAISANLFTNALSTPSASKT